MMTPRKHSLDYAGDPYSYQGGEVAADDAAQDSMMAMPDLKPDYSVMDQPEPAQYTWSMTGTHISVSPEHDHATLFDGMNHTDMTRPHAYGTVEVAARWDALWHVEGGNMALHLVEKRLRSYSRDMGWKHVAITDKSGAPFQGLKVSSRSMMYHVAPRSARESIMTNGLDASQRQHDLHDSADWNYDSEEYPFGVYLFENPDTAEFYRNRMQQTHSMPMETYGVDLPGHVADTGDDPFPDPQAVNNLGGSWYVQGPVASNRLRLLGDEKTASDPGSGWDFQEVPKDHYWNDDAYGESLDPEGEGYYGISDPTDDEIPKGPMICSECQEPFPNWATWRQHVERKHINPQREPYDLPHPVVDLDQPMPADFNTNPGQDETIMRQASASIRQRIAAGKPDPIAGPLPFIFDIEEDRIYLGHPGERHADIKGQFTPGGIVEGLYLPDGKLQYRTDTDMPYTVRHMLDLWKGITGNGLPVKSVFKLGPNGSYKLASANIGHKVRNLAFSDDAAYQAYQVLSQGGGKVYGVGGVVRDVEHGRLPKDVDLLVQGLPSETVESLLSTLPGKLDFTGSHFGVFRYRSPDGAEVEIALPRAEAPSPEAGRPDPEKTTVDHTLPVEHDLARRDFTQNAQAVDLDTGELIDPYGGSLDAKSKRLKTVSPDSFRDDPLRTVRLLTAMAREYGEPTPETTEQAIRHAPALADLEGDEIRKELDKLMKGDDPARAIQYAVDHKLIGHIFPEMLPSIGFEQRNKHHRLPLDKHLLEVLHRTAELSPDSDLRMAALMHDWGKPASVWYDDEGHGHYYHNVDEKAGIDQGLDHETVGAGLAERAMKRLHYPTKRIERVRHLVQNHMFNNFDNQKGAANVIRKVGPEHIMDLLALREADRTGKGMDEWENSVPFHVQRQLAQHVLDTQYTADFDPSRRPDQQAHKSLAINGDDLTVLGIQPGPIFTTILNELADRVTSDPSLNNRHDLLEMAQHISQGHTAKTANILDPVMPGLDPAAFTLPNDALPKMKPKVARWVEHFIHSAMTKAGWPDPKSYLNLILTGSLTTYQWSKDSDFDVSLWIDTDNLPEYVRADLISLMIEKCDGTIVPGTTHPIQCFVVDVSKHTPEDLYAEGVRSAYDIDGQEWIVPPDRSRVKDVQKEFPAMFRYAQGVADKMRMMLKYDPPAVKPLWDALHHARQRDMQAGKGDFSESNIVYKFLNNLGFMPLVSEATGEYIASVSSEPPVRPPGGLGARVRGTGSEFPEIGLGRATARGEYPWFTFTVFAAVQHSSSWADVADKAKRLVQSGQVDILTNTPTFVASQVQGDHGTYECELSRDNPEAAAIEQWSCTCPWNQYAFDRTQKWKKLEGRVCSHVMATYWKARSTPLDVGSLEDLAPGTQTPRGQKGRPGMQPGQMALPDMPMPSDNPKEKTDMLEAVPSGPPTDQTPGAGAPEDAMTAEELRNAPPTNPIAPIGPNQPSLKDMANPPVQPLGPQPVVKKQPQEKKDWLTLWDVTNGPGTPMAPVNPVSIIDGRQPNPLNPMNQPGTYSKHYQHPEMTEFVRYSVDAFQEWAQELLARGYTPSVIVVGQGVHLEARGGKQPMPGAQPVGVTKEGLPQYRTLDLGYDPDQDMRVKAQPTEAELGFPMPPQGQRDRNTLQTPEQGMEDMFPSPGAPEARGDYYPVKPGSKAELLAIEQDKRMALISVPLNSGGPLHPRHLYGWVNFDDVIANPDQRTPFRPLKRQERKPVGSDWNLDASQ